MHFLTGILIFIIKGFLTIVFEQAIQLNSDGYMKLMEIVVKFWLKWVAAKRPYEYFINKGFRTIVSIFIVIFITFPSIYPPAFFRWLSNSGTYTELRTTSFIESTGVASSDSGSHNRLQVLSIPVLLLACSRGWTCNLQMIFFLEA